MNYSVKEELRSRSTKIQQKVLLNQDLLHPCEPVVTGLP